MSPRLKVILAALLGFLVAVGCGSLQMLFFAAKENTWWIDLLTRRLPMVVCPAWALGDGSGAWMIAIPLLNAATYAGISVIWVMARQRSLRESGV